MAQGLYFLHALTALHVGVGQGAGLIDLPIARERSTALPVVPGTSVKGVARDALKPASTAVPPALTREEHLALFGPERSNAAAHAGALAFNDARLLCLPVRSLVGTMAWSTCPFVLRRFARDAGDCGIADIPASVPEPNENHALANNAIAADAGDAQRVVLEEIDLELDSNSAQIQALAEWADFLGKHVFRGARDATVWTTEFKARFAILPDAVFAFLAETGTEVRARVALTEQRTAERGALWYEENLPAETLLWGVLAADPSRRKGGYEERDSGKVLDKFRNACGRRRLQIGGKFSVGRGQVELFA